MCLNEKFRKKIQLKKIRLENFSFYDKRPLDVSMNIKKLNKNKNFKMKNIRNIILKMVKKNNVKSKIFKRR